MMHDKSMLARAHDAAVGYHLLVALLFTGCLPLAIVRAAGALGTPSGGATAGPIAAALDTARAAAAQAFSLPG